MDKYVFDIKYDVEFYLKNLNLVMNDSLSTLYVIFLFNIKLVVLTPPYYSKEKNSPCLQPITYDAIKNDFECI